jgi:hypothetical protein
MKTWNMNIGDYNVSVQQLPDGRWLASTGLKLVLDPTGSSVKQAVYDNVVDALRFVGYPVGWFGGIYLDVPSELKG